MQSIKEALRQKWLWVCLNKPFWASACLTLITVVFVLIKPAMVNGAPTDLPVRFWGMFLQLVGAYTVWIDMTKTAKDFGEQPSFRKTWQWVKGLFRTPAPVTGTATIELVGASCIATGHVVSVSQTGRPIEERLARLESDVANVSEAVSMARGDLMRQKNELTADIKQSTAVLRQEIGVVQSKLKDALVGNYAVLNLGAFWLVIGIVMSSIAVEITNLVHLHQLPRFW